MLEGRVLGSGETWYRVRLPILPNNTTGWVPKRFLGDPVRIDTRLFVDRTRLTVTLKRDGVTVFRAPIGVGESQWPTPRGEFYIRSRLTNFGSAAYGPLAFGLLTGAAVGGRYARWLARRSAVPPPPAPPTTAPTSSSGAPAAPTSTVPPVAKPAASIKRGGTLRFVAQADLKILDPVWTTAYITRNHSYLVYDTLFGTDEKFQVKPQMVDKWSVSRDATKYSFSPIPSNTGDPCRATTILPGPVSALMNVSNENVPSCGPCCDPRLRFTTRMLYAARFCSTQFIPLSSHDVWPWPSLFSTLTLMIPASGAIPR